MPFQVICPSCKSTFSAPDSAANKKAKSPQCGGVIQLSAPVSDEEILDAEEESVFPSAAHAASIGEPATAAQADGNRKPCPICGEMIQPDAIKCRFCGEIFDRVLANAERRHGPGPVAGESVEKAAKRLIAEKHDKTTALQLFLTSLIGCFSPILAIYGIVFLPRRPYPFPRKRLAIAGTLIHGFWTLAFIAGIIAGPLQK